MDNLSAIATAKEECIAEGIEKGKEEGLKEGKLETAKKMLADGLSIDIVSKYTGLSEEGLENL